MQGPAFRRRDGQLAVVIGGVVGHDTRAAAAMGQLRGILRTFAHAATDPPGQVLAAVDEAIAGLALSTLASAVLAEPTPPATADAGRMPVRWSNAGHPAPLLLEPGRPARSTATGYAASWPRPTGGARPGCSEWSSRRPCRP